MPLDHRQRRYLLERTLLFLLAEAGQPDAPISRIQFRPELKIGGDDGHLPSVPEVLLLVSLFLAGTELHQSLLSVLPRSTERASAEQWVKREDYRSGQILWGPTIHHWENAGRRDVLRVRQRVRRESVGTSSLIGRILGEYVGMVDAVTERLRSRYPDADGLVEIIEDLEDKRDLRIDHPPWDARALVEQQVASRAQMAGLLREPSTYEQLAVQYMQVDELDALADRYQTGAVGDLVRWRRRHVFGTSKLLHDCGYRISHQASDEKLYALWTYLEFVDALAACGHRSARSGCQLSATDSARGVPTIEPAADSPLAHLGGNVDWHLDVVGLRRFVALVDTDRNFRDANARIALEMLQHGCRLGLIAFLPDDVSRGIEVGALREHEIWYLPLIPSPEAKDATREVLADLVRRLET